MELKLSWDPPARYRHVPGSVHLSYLDGERRLRGAVEAGVALEALAEAVVAVADAAIRAGRDVLEVASGGRGELDELDVARVGDAVAIRVRQRVQARVGPVGRLPVDRRVEHDAEAVLEVGGLGGRVGVRVRIVGEVRGRRLLLDPDLGDGEHVARVGLNGAREARGADRRGGAPGRVE